MSVVSEKSHRRPFVGGGYGPQGGGYGRCGPSTNGFSSSRSAVEVDYLLPRFSAAASEGLKHDYGRDDENTTVVTGATSEHSYSGGGGYSDRFELDSGAAGGSTAASGRRCCTQILWRLFTILLAGVALLSAPAMIVAPFLLGNLPPFLASLRPPAEFSGSIGRPSKALEFDWPPVQCEVDCQGGILNVAFKLCLLLMTFYVLFGRCALANLPRLDVTRALFIFLTLFALFAFWLFYVVRILIERDFRAFVPYAQHLVDLLMFINFMHVIYELRQLRTVYVVTIVRDPDGESQTEQLGQMTIQNAAIHILKFYHANFPTFNPHWDGSRQAAILNGGASGGRFSGGGGGRYGGGTLGGFRGGFKFYDIESGESGRSAGGCDPKVSTLPEENARVLLETSARRRLAGHNNDVLHAESEFERRLDKRRCRLIGCTEEVFAHVQALNANSTNSRMKPMGPQIAAETVMAGLQKPLLRYLKYTRQQPYQNRQYILAHLERCMTYGFSARTFLQRFFSRRLPPLAANAAASAAAAAALNDAPGSQRERRSGTMAKSDEWTTPAGESKWSILCPQPASGQLRHGVQFVLRSHGAAADAGVQLHCTISAFPFYNLTEQRALEKKYLARELISRNPIA